ncbi:hypothetical protein [Marinicella rhabdoformis]|uniref:hypothetical protein n=1 Tax=Marinicella rhabdoformis TaxID=2580566 RepID=UPI0012AEB599|nr:hypothetical protein [Marinicella rhabdoformis]
MDQDKNNNTGETDSEVIIEAGQAQETDMDNESEAIDSPSLSEPKIIIKKSSNKLALFLSLLALAAPAYLLYIEFLSNQETLDTAVFDNQIQQLGEANKKLSDQLQSLTTRYDNELTGLKDQLNQIKQQPVQANESNAFDNSKNEAALLQLEQQLNQQISDHATALSSLKQSIAAAQETNRIAKEVLPTATDAYDTQRAIDALYAADLLLRTNRLPQAISTLQQLQATARLKTSTQQQIKHLLTQWQQVQQPDNSILFSELQSLKQQVKALTLSTQKADTSEDSWYHRFISVKKIETDGTLADSHELHLLKAQLTQHLLQAEWALTLQQESAWNQQLKAAAIALREQMPKQTALVKQLNDLATKRIIALLPTPSGIHDVINELKGLR